MDKRQRQQRLPPSRSGDVKNLGRKRGSIAVTTREPIQEPMQEPIQERQVVPEGDDALAASLAKEMAHLLDALPDGVIIADDAGRIQFANRQVADLFGYRQETLPGQPVEALMPSRFRAAHPVHRADYATHPRLRPMGIGLQLFGLRQDGTEFPVEISLSPITFAGAPLVLGTIRDVTDQRLLEQRTRDALTGRLAMLQAILDELPVSVYLARGIDAELVLANREMATIWGAEWQEGQPMAAFLAASGAHVHDLQGRELPVEHLATVRALHSGQSVRQHQETIRRADGSTINVLVNAIALAPQVFPVHSDLSARPEHPIPVVLVVHQDVSALKEAERLKDEFVALAAHELRNPVAALLGYAQLLIQATGPHQRLSGSPQAPQAHSPQTEANASTGSMGSMGSMGAEKVVPAETAADMNAEIETVPEVDKVGNEMPASKAAIPREWQVEAATAVMEASQRLAALTDDLLDATRLQANRLELRSEPIELGALVRRVVKRTQVTTERHHFAVSASAEPMLVEADAQRVEQVVTNLLSNAIKYSPEGGPIEVRVWIHETVSIASRDSATGEGSADTGAWVGVAVSDHGMGIPAEQHDRIFQRFGRADNAREHGIPGTGLGLYLCRELIERQDGHLWFESVAGAGTTFTFELPQWTEPES